MALYDISLNTARSLQEFHPGVNWKHKGCIDLKRLELYLTAPGVMKATLAGLAKTGVISPDTATAGIYQVHDYWDNVQGKPRITIATVKSASRVIITLTLVQ